MGNWLLCNLFLSLHFELYLRDEKELFAYFCKVLFSRYLDGGAAECYCVDYMVYF